MTLPKLPPEAAGLLRPVLPALADETIAAIAREVPDYERAMEGYFGRAVRMGVEVALTSAYRCSDDRTCELVQKVDGDIVANVRMILSADGKTMTKVVTQSRDSGDQTEDTVVFETQ